MIVNTARPSCSASNKLFSNNYIKSVMDVTLLQQKEKIDLFDKLSKELRILKMSE